MQKINRALTMHIPVNGLGQPSIPTKHRPKTNFGSYEVSNDYGLGKYNTPFMPKTSLGSASLGSLGQDPALDAAINSGVTDATALATTYLNNALAGHPWINAQNTAEAGIAAVVAAYVQLKNNPSGNLLTPSYIQQAILKVQAIATGFVNYVKTFNTPAATKGGQDIQNNANAVVTNMQIDAANLPYSAVLAASATGASSTTASLNSLLASVTSSPILLIGIVAVVYFAMRKD
jgi:hypothetical protein